jgi:hypothetical protein
MLAAAKSVHYTHFEGCHELFTRRSARIGIRWFGGRTRHRTNQSSGKWFVWRFCDLQFPPTTQLWMRLARLPSNSAVAKMRHSPQGECDDAMLGATKKDPLRAGVFLAVVFITALVGNIGIRV